MAHKIERIEAKRLYLEEKLSLEEIAKRMPQVSIASLYRWSKEESWDKEREEVALTSYGAYKRVLQLAADKITEIAQSGQIDARAADAVTKLLKSVKTLFKDVDAYGNILLAVGELTEFLAERDHDLLEKLHPFLVEFGSAMSKKYGKGN